MNKKILIYIKLIIIFIMLLLSIYLFKVILDINILSTKYIIILISILVILNIIGILTLISKRILFNILSIIIYFILVIICILGINIGSSTLSFLNNAFNNNTVEINTYNVIILKNKYEDIYKLNNKKIGYYLEDNDKEEVLNNIDDLIKVDKISYEDIYELYNNLLSKELDAILIASSYLDLLEEDNKDIYDNIDIIYSFEIENILTKKENSIDKLKPLNIYISGSDSRSKTIYNKSRSDVNMILTINPNTKHILITSIPRDYYVQVHGQTGLKDKLTHSGIYGLEVSEKTIEDLFDIEIDYSIKINFNAVTEIVDLVGGIEVYSDSTFNSYHKKGWTVKKGYNYMDGEKALAYSRERYAYSSGDRHRIQNQQQVLEAVFKKIMKDKSILIKYDELLVSLNNLYRTTIPKEVISLFVKNQIDNMSTSTFDSNWVNGSNASLPTHTAPKSKRYVMIPYEDDVKKAHDKITKVLAET